MNTNEKCLLNYLSDYSMMAFEASYQLIEFLSLRNIKVNAENFNPVCGIIEEMEKETGF